MSNDTKTLIENILEQARWAPSGDNMQTWRFECTDDNHFVIHGYDTRDHCVYDLKGQASQLAIGILMESIAIAASYYKHNAEFILLEDKPDNKPTIKVTLIEDPSLKPDPLYPELPKRSVQRRAFKTTPLTQDQKEALEESVGNFYYIIWFEKWHERLKTAILMFKNGKLRLTLPEAFATHSSIIEWGVRYSKNKIPDKAIGLDPITSYLMKWALKSWERVKFLNTYLAGTLTPRIELDLVPGIFCAAHFALISKEIPVNTLNNLNAGRSIQRLWLKASQLDLQLQPETTPVIFSGYIKAGIQFSKEPALIQYAQKLSKQFQTILGNEAIEKVVFFGRIGTGKRASSRSIRLSVNELLSNSLDQTKPL